MLSVILLIVLGLVVFVLSFLKDWLIYKHRGRAQPDANDENETVIANPEDAISHRVIDLGKLNSSDQYKKQD